MFPNPAVTQIMTICVVNVHTLWNSPLIRDKRTLVPGVAPGCLSWAKEQPSVSCALHGRWRAEIHSCQVALTQQQSGTQLGFGVGLWMLTSWSSWRLGWLCSCICWSNLWSNCSYVCLRCQTAKSAMVCISLFIHLTVKPPSLCVSSKWISLCFYVAGGCIVPYLADWPPRRLRNALMSWLCLQDSSKGPASSRFREDNLPQWDRIKADSNLFRWDLAGSQIVAPGVGDLDQERYEVRGWRGEGRKQVLRSPFLWLQTQRLCLGALPSQGAPDSWRLPSLVDKN